MIPRVQVETSVSFDGEKLRIPTADLVRDGARCIHGYDPGFYSAASWASAEETLLRETEALASGDAAAKNPEEFDDLAYRAECELFHGVELGVLGRPKPCAPGQPAQGAGGHQPARRPDGLPSRRPG